MVNSHPTKSVNIAANQRTTKRMSTTPAKLPVYPGLTPEQTAVLTKLTFKIHELGLTVEPLADVSVGPVISVYRFVPKGSTKVTQLEALSDDLSLILRKEVLVKRMPGETAVSITVPNDTRCVIKWLDTVTHVYKAANPHGAAAIMDVMAADHEVLPLGFGVDYLGTPFIEDLTTLPHLLIAGTTGGGKSTLIASIIASLAYSMPKSRLQFALSDTKGVEFVPFLGLPHLLYPIATTLTQTIQQMAWLGDEVNNRLSRIGRAECRNIHEYNLKLTCGLEQKCDGSRRDTLPYIVLVIDELADIVDCDNRKVALEAEQKLGYLVQKARASGIYVIAATQRPSVDKVIGSIKANFPGRLTFKLPSAADSRTIIDTGGAEALLARGDMLYKSNRGLLRLHAPIATIGDIKGAVDMAVRREE